jgi:type 2 lantibiotic biosynthesis protein LanM
MPISEPRVSPPQVGPRVAPARRATGKAQGRARTSRRRRLLEIIAQAAAPAERAGLPCFGVRERVDTERTIESREAAWVQALTGGDRAAFAGLLATRGLDLAQARRGLADVVVTDATLLPSWARDILMLFSGDARSAACDREREAVPTFTLDELSDTQALKLMAADPTAPWSLHRIFEPLVRRGARHVGTLVALSEVPIGVGAQRQLLAALAQRMSGPCTSVLFHRLTVDDAIVDHPGVVGETVYAAFFSGDGFTLDQWSHLFQTYPVLARLIAVAYRNWCEATAELVARLNRDRERLGSTIGAGRLGELVECTMGMGDSHDHGRTVAMLAFGCGTRVVYKPKDLRVASAYMRLVRRLNCEGLEPPLATRRVVEGNGYGWEEFVGERACASAEEVHRFYVRMGMHARLIQLLDGVDFTGDNVIAAGDAPALVDLEALLTPRIPVDGHSPVHTEALVRAFESPARGCLITAKILGERGRPAAELGALAPSAECLSPFKQRVVRVTDAGPGLVDIYPEFPAFRVTPTRDGVRVDSTEHFGDVITGYVAMGEHLRRLHPVLADEDGPLSRIGAVRVRCLCRNTHTYARMLQASLTPLRLRDGVERELCLERMWKARFTSPAVVAAEIEDLRDLDVPMFASRAGSSQLLKEGAVLVEDLFAGTAADRLAERVRALPSTTCEHDRELIESVLFTLAPTVRRLTVPVTAEPRVRVPDWVSVAERVGQEIVAASISTKAESKWVGGNCQPWSGSWGFGVIADDLYSGAAGIGLVLAELAAATHAPEFVEAASGALRGVNQRLGRAYAQTIVDPVAHPPGAMFGWGGQIYACDRGADLLGDESLRNGGTRLLLALAQSGATRCGELLARSGAWDVATGAAGLLLAVLATTTGTDAARAIIGTAVSGLLSRHLAAGDADPPLYPANCIPRAIVGRTMGIQLALARWQAPLGATDVELPSSQSLYPLAETETRLTAGDLLGLLAIARGVSSLRPAALLAVDQQLRDSITDTDGLGWLERGEIALAAHLVADGDRYLLVAQDAGERLCTIKTCTGRWLPECLLADRYNFSAVVGLGAIAHFYLRLTSPDLLRSYRVLE